MRGPVPKRSDQRRRRNTWIDAANEKVPVTIPDEPPRAGKGSAKQAWTEYARALGHSVPKSATRAEIIAMVEAGHTSENEWHLIAREWFDSLAESGQSRFYEPSDWATARVLAEVLSRALSARKTTAALIERWQAGATELLTTEGARRRARMELERHSTVTDEEEDENVSWLDDARLRLRGTD
jgi:hypothetical protein